VAGDYLLNDNTGGNWLWPCEYVEELPEGENTNMKKIIVLSFTLAIVAAAFVWAQQTKGPVAAHPQYEVHAVFPHETSPAMYEQVSQQEIQTLASQGWELVSVMPFVYRNEERGPALNNKPAVTQGYPAYFFKRVKR
jgi:hypothetical protein